MGKGESYRWTIVLWDLVYLSKSFKNYIGKSGCCYIRGQIEECPDTKRLHVQGYVEFKTRITVRGLTRIFGVGNKFIMSAGNQESNISYTSKDDSAVEWAERFCYGVLLICGKGARNDLYGSIEMLEEGFSSKDVAKAYPVPYVMYSKGLEKLEEIYKSERYNAFRPNLEVHIIWGESGIGKTRYVYEKCKGNLYIESVGKWFDNWNRVDPLLIDDYKPGDMSDTLLKRILDIYPVRVEVKGSTIQVYCTEIYITSNYDPRLWGDEVL